MKSEPLSNYKQEDQSLPKLYYNGKGKGEGMVIVMSIKDMNQNGETITSYISLYSERKDISVGSIHFQKPFHLESYNSAVKLSNN